MSEQHEPILEMMLEELLSEKRPPDLRQSILNRMHEDNSLRFADWDHAIAGTWSPIATETEQINSVSDSSPVQVPSRTVVSLPRRSRNATLRRTLRWVWGGVGVAAASALLYVVGPMGLTDRQVPGERDTVENKKASPAKSPLEPNVEPPNPTRKSIPLPADSLPFGPSSVAENRAAAKQVDSPKYKIAESAIVDVIDQQFVSIWDQFENPYRSMEATPEQWIARVTYSLLGREPNEEEKTRGDGVRSPAERGDFLETLAKSREFANHWSGQLADLWLGQKSRTERSPQRMAFENWLADRIHEGSSLKQIQASMLVSKGSDQLTSPDYQPESHWIFASHEGGSAKFAERFTAGMLENASTCVQCHQDGRFGRPQVYWGVAAFLSRIAIESDSKDGKSLRRVVWKKPVEKFYERADGTMAIANEVFPDGTPVESTEASMDTLAAWMETSSIRKEAFVNQVWKILSGKQLVPRQGLGEKEGIQERSDLRTFLAQQWGAHGEDIRKLVTWIAASRPLRSVESSLSLDEYFLASEGELESWRRADRQMAIYHRPENSRDANPNARIARLIQWIKKDDDTFLAQPRDQQWKPRPNAKSPTQAQEHVRLFVHARGLPTELDQQITQWISSKMSWEQLVEHASLISRGSSASGKFQELANDVLKQCSGDRRTAITRILLTELGYF